MAALRVSFTQRKRQNCTSGAFGQLAQLDRAMASGAIGRAFESRIAHYFAARAGTLRAFLMDQRLPEHHREVELVCLAVPPLKPLPRGSARNRHWGP